MLRIWNVCLAVFQKSKLCKSVAEILWQILYITGIRFFFSPGRLRKISIVLLVLASMICYATVLYVNKSVFKSIGHLYDYQETRKIFFVVLYDDSQLNARRSCAIESAARRNPSLETVVYMTSPEIYVNSSNMAALLRLNNLRVQNLDVDDLFSNSPLKFWFENGEWKDDTYDRAILQNALSLVLLWKHGGIYLDLNVIVIKSLQQLRNCMGRKNERNICSEVLIFDKLHPFLVNGMNELKLQEYASGRKHFEPNFLTQVLNQQCGREYDLSKRSSKKALNCGGVLILPAAAFNGLQRVNWLELFYPGNGSQVIQRWKENSYSIFVWPEFSEHVPIISGSNQPYEVMMKMYCPWVYALNKDRKSF